MAHALARALRSLLARCSTKCPCAAVAAASSSCLRSAVPRASYAACPRSILPTSCGGAVPAAQTRFLASTAGPGPGDEGSGEEEEEESMAEWEEDEDDGADAEIGDGGNGGGVALRDVKWGARALAAAEEVLGEHFGDDIAMFAFKVSPKGYVYVRLDKLTNRYGCPGIEEIENFNRLYKQKLDEIIERGEIPLDLALEISSPGAERLLKVPGDLDRFKDMAMRVQYHAEGDGLISDQMDGIFMLESVDIQAEHCVWKLADVSENRAGKGRPLNRKQKDWRLQTSFDAVMKATLYLD
ncbi:hypothetical protein CFC21_023310 [Triticum aestivum]|uniref:DUF7912 domain-containing protein n=2 Tax=Triticum aestivum TaxID=4565 RepID=A0A3B6C5D7_WHEAT|nr:uncharacterized protein LOC119363805 [Triticum dicoccoides]XP_044323862.1 uncharacterized protein LOC123045020 [Triticum aestivum]KAF7008586.1 hypothetical protein CFC21_023310 [Triticum aestivum]